MANFILHFNSELEIEFMLRSVRRMFHSGVLMKLSLSPVMLEHFLISIAALIRRNLRQCHCSAEKNQSSSYERSDFIYRITLHAHENICTNNTS